MVKMLNTRDLYARSPPLASPRRSLVLLSREFASSRFSITCARATMRSARLLFRSIYRVIFSSPSAVPPSGGPKKVLSRGASSLSVSRRGNKSFRLTKHSNDSCAVYFWWVNTPRARNKVSPRADARAWKNTALPGESARALSRARARPRRAMRIATLRRRREEGNANENRKSATNGAIAAHSLSYRVFFPRRRKRVHF